MLFVVVVRFFFLYCHATLSSPLTIPNHAVDQKTNNIQQNSKTNCLHSTSERNAPHCLWFNQCMAAPLGAAEINGWLFSREHTYSGSYIFMDDARHYRLWDFFFSSVLFFMQMLICCIISLLIRRLSHSTGTYGILAQFQPSMKLYCHEV